MRTTALPFSRWHSGTVPSRAAGFTLLELMLVITVAAVILGLGIPNLTQFIRNNRMTAAANDMLAAVHLARTEAVKRRAFTTFCFTDNPNDATPTCANAGRGWVVFADGNGNYTVDGGEDVLLRHEVLPAVFTSMNKSPANTRGLIFAPSGFRQPGSNPLDDVVLCDVRGNVAVYGAENSAARWIEISPTGRPQVNRAVAGVTGAGGC